MHKPWKDSEVETLRTLLLHGRSYAEIAKVLKRTPTSIGGKACKLGIYKVRQKAPKPVQQYPSEYYEGVAADSEIECPYGLGEMGKRCWWMAGLADGQKGAA